MPKENFAKRGLLAFLSAVKSVSEQLSDEVYQYTDAIESISASDSSDEEPQGTDEEQFKLPTEDKFAASAATILKNVAEFYSSDASMPSSCEKCLRSCILQAHTSNDNAFTGRLGIRNALQLRTVDAEYILIDAPLQRRHTLLIDPLRLIACVCQDFVSEQAKGKPKIDFQAGISHKQLTYSRSELFKQFALDFPRLTMVINGERLGRNLTPFQCMQRLSNLMGDDLALQVLVLTTQGALAPIFNWVHSTFGDYQSGTHVTGGGCQEVHVQCKPLSQLGSGSKSAKDYRKDKVAVEVLLLKPFQVIKVKQGEVIPQTDLWCQTRLSLAPYQGGEVTLSVPSEQSKDLQQSVAIPITEGLLKMSPQHPQEPFALTPSQWSWEMVAQQCECEC